METLSGEIVSPASTDLVPSKGIRVVAATHPLKVGERVDRYVNEGLTLAEILEVVQPDALLRLHAHIFINDIRIPQVNWHLVRPKYGAIITIRVLPQGGGGGGKSPLRIILTIAVLAATLAFAQPLGAYLLSGAASTGIAGFTITAAQLGGALISVVGGLLVNALAPIRPPKLNDLSSSRQGAESPTLSITGSRNQANLFGPIPVVLGRHKMVPPYGALPYTELVGNDQYLRMVFVWGKGPLLIENLKIGENPLSNYTDIQYINRSGYPEERGLSIYTNDVYEDGQSVVITSSGGYVTRNSQINADEVSVDFIFPKGITVLDDAGNRTNHTVEFEVQYAPMGSDTWVGAGVPFGLRTSPNMLAEDNVTRVLKPGITARQAYFYTHEAGYPESYVYNFITNVNPHRYDLLVMDRWSGDLSIIRGTTVMGTTIAAIPTYPSTQVPLAAIYRDTSAVIVTSNIIDKRPADPSWGFGFAVSANGTNSVTVASGTLNSARQRLTYATNEAVRYTVPIGLPSRGQYQIRVRKLTTDSNDNRTFNDMVWNLVRTITFEPPFDANGLATTEIRVKATDQLNNVIDQFSGIVTSILPDYDVDLDDWVVRPTQNPASLLRAVLQGPGNARGVLDSRIDFDSLEAFHNYCRINNFQFNMVRDFVSSVYNTMLDICSVAFASPSQVDGKWGVIIDQDKTVPVQHFTPRNSWGFNFERSYPDKLHGWRIRFVNENNDFKQDERIVYDDGYDKTNATKFEGFDLTGITNPDTVWKVGRRRIAEGRLRPEKYNFNIDIENLVCIRGDLVLITHDVISLGLGSGRLKSLISDGSGNVTGVIIDTPVDMSLGVDYGIVIRTVSGKIQRQVITEPGIDVSTLNFITPIPSAEAPGAKDLYGFGELGSETLEALVTRISPMANMTAALTCVPLSREIFSAETGIIPEFVPSITSQPGTNTPYIVGIRSDESVLAQLPNGTLVPNLRITLGRFSASVITPATGVEIQYKAINEIAYRSKFVSRQESLEVDLSDVVQGVTYQVKLRYTYANKSGNFSPEYTHTVVGMSTLPGNIIGLVLEGNYLRWQYNKPRDFSGFLCRTSTDTKTLWENMYPAHSGILTEAQLDISNFQRGTRIFAVKALDLGGNESETALTLIRDFGQALLDNVVDTIDYDTLGFPGTLVGCEVDSGILKSLDLSTYLPNGSNPYLTVGSDAYLPSQYDSLEYTTDPLIIDASHLPGSIKINEVSENIRIQYRVGVDSAYLPTGSDPYLPTDSDPYLPSSWLNSEYRDFPEYVDLQSGDVFQFKLTNPGGESQSTVTNFDVIIDVEDELEQFQGIVLDPAGSRLPLTKTYRSIRVVNGNLRSGSTAVSVQVIDFDNSLGPLVRAFDATGTGVTATIDGFIQGAKG